MIVFNKDEIWSADLVDMHAFSSFNKGFKYILIVIDVFSKYAWAVQIKDKSASSVTKAIEKIISDRIPKKLLVDEGKEFYNATFKKHLNKHKIDDVPRSTSYGVYISQLIRFARVSSHVVDFNARNKSLTAKLLQQGYRYHKLRKTFSKFYRRHYELVSKFNVGLKTLLHQGLSEPEFYGDLVYKFKKR